MKRKKQQWRERIDVSGLRPIQRYQPYFFISVLYFCTFLLFTFAFTANKRVRSSLAQQL